MYTNVKTLPFEVLMACAFRENELSARGKLKSTTSVLPGMSIRAAKDWYFGGSE